MAYWTIDLMTKDDDLVARITAAVAQEAFTNPQLSVTAIAEQWRNAPATGGQYLAWPISSDNVAAYESALASGVPDPGKDASVITDGAILAGVQAYWPMEGT